jgi:RNase H-fold protein (predicted Holliday junction resolvase)
MMPEEEIIIAIDPGTKKCGYAVINSHLRVLQKEVVPTEQMTKRIQDSLNIYKLNKIILGNGTNYQNLEERLKHRGTPSPRYSKNNSLVFKSSTLAL